VHIVPGTFPYIVAEIYPGFPWIPEREQGSRGRFGNVPAPEKKE
jgi:hypothetical protein